ncbi:MAG: hypothetical protein J4F28_08555 [Nitrosopumilaceae archaeon]|nr:hypothetical protein [Nitrosopumilaceae archaeon]
MIEALLLTSLAVTIVGILAVWMGALDEDAWRISGYGAHCTLNIVLFEDVGGGRNFLDVNVVNSGRQDIHGVSIMNGNTLLSSSSLVLVPGNRTAEFVGPNTPVENLEALATYEDGSTSICKKSYNAGVH